MGKLMQKMMPGIRPLPAGVPFKNIDVLIATWFGSGLLKPGPGTMGTLAAIPLGYSIALYGGPLALAAAAAILFYIGTKSAEKFGKMSGEKDDQRIVVDEVVGLWIAAVPAEGSPALWLTAFIMFRFFDITKVWPASYYDKRKGGGYDVMMDDVVAGFFAFLCVASQAYTMM